MGGWWLSDLWASPNGQVIVVSWISWVILSITLHELAHGWAAIKLGDDTPIRLGHMTWNPMVHMGGYSLVALLLVGIAWGAMPVDPSKLRGKYAETLVAIAGPMMNLALGLIALLAYVLWQPLAEGYLVSGFTIQEPLSTNLQIFLHSGALLNFVLMLFNLLPVPPLDGGRIMMDLSSPYRRLMESGNGQWVGLGVFILFFVFGAEILFGIAGSLVYGFSDIVRSILFPSMP
ncbi:MAG: site-2 protease family protein [Phycisphaerales bacterium]